MKNAIVLLSMVVILGGCQTLQPVEHATTLDNTTFMGLWNTYLHCQAGDDPASMKADAHRLSLAAQTAGTEKHFSFLPDALTRRMAPMAPRLAADPKAMAAACTLYTGQAALQAGRQDVAAEMFRTVLQNYPQQDFVYYVSQARAGLDQMYRDLQIVQHEPGTVSVPKPIASAASPNDLSLRVQD